MRNQAQAFYKIAIGRTPGLHGQVIPGTDKPSNQVLLAYKRRTTDLSRFIFGRFCPTPTLPLLGIRLISSITESTSVCKSPRPASPLLYPYGIHFTRDGRCSLCADQGRTHAPCLRFPQPIPV